MKIVHYAKFFLSPSLTVISAFAILQGGASMWVGLVSAIVLMLILDNLLGGDHSQPKYDYLWLISVPLYVALPAVFVLQLSLAYAARAESLWQSQSGFWNFAAALLGSALASVGNGMTAGHELIHRTGQPSAVVMGRWLFALIGHADFSIEHLQGHHARVGTFDDPATARRGESAYHFFIRSSVQGHKHAWLLEKKRLQRWKQPCWSLHNRMLSGYGMTLTWLGLFAGIAGYFGMFTFLVQACLGRFFLELVNYIEHYGLTRKETEKVLPRHSWDSNRPLSHIMLLALPRHAAHHANGRLPFYELSPSAEAPQLPFGYLTCMLIALFPGVWYKIMDRELHTSSTRGPKMVG